MATHSINQNPGESSIQTSSKESVDVQYASLSARFAALLIDNFVVAGLLFGVVILPETLAGIYVLLWVVFVLFYQFILEGIRTNQTFGKYVLGIKLAKDDGRDATVVNSIIRNLVGIIGQAFGFIGLAVGAFAIHQSEENTRIGDSAASTIVIKVDS